MVTGTFCIVNIYASILFDKFRKMINQKISKLNDAYMVEVANGKIERTIEILTNCLLTLNNDVFPIDLMPMTIGSFDVIIGMDWLSTHRAEILCYEKVVVLSLPKNEALVIYGDKAGKNLRIITCMKARKHFKKICYTFLAHGMNTQEKGKEIEDIL